MITGLNCAFCKHLRSSQGETLTCEAFPNGIPEPIATTKVEHTSSYPSDNGIRFEPSEEFAFMFEETPA
jgi:hypothetical protein